MSTENDPEWISTTFVTGVLYEGDKPEPLKVRVGLVRMPDGGGIRIAAQGEGRGLFVLPPASAARFIGALGRGIKDAGAS